MARSSHWIDRLRNISISFPKPFAFAPFPARGGTCVQGMTKEANRFPSCSMRRFRCGVPGWYQGFGKMTDSLSACRLREVELQEAIMLKDRRLIWILEYVFGGTLVVVTLAPRVLWPPAWTEAHLWAAQLFVASLGVILVSCASSMRQRLLLARRIDALARQMADGCRPSSQPSP